MADTPQDQAPNPVDLHVGSRVRMRRKMIGVTQEALAGALGVTFQQIQKYERGANRVSASKLYAIATALHAPVSFFFDGLAEPDGERYQDENVRAADKTLQAFMATSEALEIAALFPRVPAGRVRRQVVDLVKAMADAS